MIHPAPHLVVSISGHGFGHVAQTAPVLNRLHQIMPQLHITVRSSVPIEHLRSRIQAPFTHLVSVGDIGMVMSSALLVDIDKSRAAYREFHADWDARVNAEAALLLDLKADMVLSNVGYLALAGAQRAKIRNAALCSLNWSDIYRHYCGDDEIARQIQSSYSQADIFLRATPGMEMSDIPRLLAISPIAEPGTNRSGELRHHLKLSTQEKLVLISMGGISNHLPIDNWPRIDGVRYLVQEETHHPDAFNFNNLTFTFNELMLSCDALLCKPGYGSFMEAACSGVPVLYVTRPDWPESPALISWLQQHGVCREISAEAFARGDLKAELDWLWQQTTMEKVIPDGANQVADWLFDKLSRPGD
jgi:hypothetical protein